MKVSSTGAERVIFLEWTEEVFSVRCTGRHGDEFVGRSLGGVAVIRIYDAAELLFAAHASSELRSKGIVQHLVVHADTPMRA